MKIRETSEVEVVDGRDNLMKDGFIDIHDAMEYTINMLGNDTNDYTKLIIKQKVTIVRTE